MIDFPVGSHHVHLFVFHILFIFSSSFPFPQQFFCGLFYTNTVNIVFKSKAMAIQFLLILSWLVYGWYTFCSECFLTFYQTLQTICFLSKGSVYFNFMRILFLYGEGEKERDTSTSYRNDYVRLLLELYTCTFISVVNLSYRSFRQLSVFTLSPCILCSFFFSLSFNLCPSFHLKSPLMRLKSGFHISTSTSFIVRQKKKYFFLCVSMCV